MVRMDVTLAARYRVWMLMLFPSTLGIGALALWLRALNWPRRITLDGVILRNRRVIRWQSVKEVCVRRHCRDGHVSRIDIRYAEGSISIPIKPLQDGQSVARVLLSAFREAISRERHSMAAPHTDGDQIVANRQLQSDDRVGKHDPRGPLPDLGETTRAAA
jgi:hypothetical protein